MVLASSPGGSVVDRSKGSARHKVLITRCRIGAPIYRGLGYIAWYGLLAARGPITPTPQSRPSGLIPGSRHGFFNVIAGLVPAIHGFTRREKDVAGRREDGHDEVTRLLCTDPPVQPERTGQPCPQQRC